ncbi:methionyl-tRNA formyltransferase [Stenoxybacter acetivorans]|uniref:methionyl-tRNA formyltransferase n=1 Tax=Stenoxybacter acetivorans TaxID=422441 RepID=UPI00055F149B|nr:methionyl-tRNA formyltransferase [Stenoxybacter acetivorans]
MKPRVIFAGTPDFAAAALTAVVEAGFDVPLVLTQPDRPKGRGMALQASAVKQTAERLGLPVAQPTTLRTPEAADLLAAQRADVMVVAAYGLLLPENILNIPRKGCLNIHASLLPRWRGAAPIQRAIEAGDAQTGVCIMQMDKGLDTGGVVSRHVYHIQPFDTAQTVHDALAKIGAHAIAADLHRLDDLQAVPQDGSNATYAPKLSKAEAEMDWTQPADVLARRVRAFNPVPGAWTTHQGKILKIWQAEAVNGKGKAGEVLLCQNQCVVACGEKALSLQVVQPAGGKPMPIGAFLAGNRVEAGQVFAYRNTNP